MECNSSAGGERGTHVAARNAVILYHAECVCAKVDVPLPKAAVCLCSVPHTQRKGNFATAEFVKKYPDVSRCRQALFLPVRVLLFADAVM